MSNDPARSGWYEVFNDNVDHLVGIDLQTNNPEKVIRTTALQHHSVHDTWTHLIESGNSLAKVASGWMGIVNITLPILSTTCVSAPNNGSIIPIWADMPQSAASPSTTLSVYIGAVPNANFTGANCSVNVRQGHFRKSFEAPSSYN